MSGMKEILAVLGVTAERPGGDFVNFPAISEEQFEKEIKEFCVKHFGDPNEDEISVHPAA